MQSNWLTKLLLLSIFLILPLTFFGQKTEIDANILADYSIAKKLYNNRAYAAAQPKFMEVSKMAIKSSNLKADASFYEAMCALKLKEAYADKKILAFVENYPNSNKKNTAFFDVGNYYFANKKAAHSLKWYTKVDKDLLSKENKNQLAFNSAYALLVTNNFEEAKNKFVTLVNDPKYGNDSRYYYGYIAYKQEDYDLAEKTLKDIADDKTYTNEVSYYLLDISFQGAKFERSIDIGKKLLPKAKRNQKSDINKIIGESYFNLEQYKEAIPYLKLYKKKWNNTDYYQLGFAYFKQDDYENAINNFNKIIDGKNKIAQNAYYNLGECYLKVDKKTEALNAFKSASEMSYSSKIKEDASLNYAKLSYEEGNPFQPVSEILINYLEKYPNSTSYNEINDLLISSFLTQQDYQGALDFLKSSNRNKEKINEVSLYRGIQLYNDAKIETAIPYFITAQNSADTEIKNRGKYWEAEANYQLENYEEALAKFSNLTGNRSTSDELQLIDYNIGYTHFKLKNYNQASVAFNSFLSNANPELEEKQDALVRFADCKFAVKEYQNAINGYQKVIDNEILSADYATYQKAISYGFLGDNDKKIAGLQRMVNTYNDSNLQDDALFQIGATYSTLSESEKAHQAFNRLLTKHEKSVFVPRTLIRQGLLFYNDNNNEEALKNFKRVAQQFPSSQEAIEAVTNAKNIYIDNGNIDAYVAWTKNLKFVNVKNSDIDNAKFASAEKKYTENADSQAKIRSLVSYLKSFPNGLHAVKANFYLAETYYKIKNFDATINNYQFVINQGQNEFSEESLLKLSEIYLEKEDYSKSIPLLIQLENQAYSVENIIFARQNLMQSYYKTNAFDLAISYAEKVLAKEKLENTIANDAKVIIARSALKNNNFDKAQEYYTAVENNATGELKAEALYYSAYFKNYDKAFEDSNKVVQELIANYSNYKYWGVKSYVVMAKNYYGLKDVYQATYVLENIIENFEQFEDIIMEAKSELNTIKSKEANNNESINTKNK